MDEKPKWQICVFSKNILAAMNRKRKEEILVADQREE